MEHIKLKSDKEYAKIDKRDRKREKELFKSSRKMFKEFDKNNKYWVDFIKSMPEDVQVQIMGACPFASTAVMLWLSVGNAKTRDMKSQLIRKWQKRSRKRSKKENETKK